jgi:hypothetical protein
LSGRLTWLPAVTVAVVVATSHGLYVTGVLLLGSAASQLLGVISGEPLAVLYRLRRGGGVPGRLLADRFRTIRRRSWA